MNSFDVSLEIANLIAGTTITYLTTAQVSYLGKIVEQLPKKRLNIIYEKVNGKIPSDAYVDIFKLNLERALQDARELIDVDVLTIASKPISKVLEMAGNDTTKSFDEVVEAICEDRTKQLRDPYICRDTTLHTFRDEVGKQASLAIYDCDKLLSEEAFAGELASFRKAIVSKFTPRQWDAREASYIEAINMIVDIAKADATGDKHYTKVVERTIVVFQKALSKSKYTKTLTARKHILFEQLPIYAEDKDIGWALGEDWIGLDLVFPIACSHCRTQLVNLGFRTMGNLTDPTAKKVLEPFPDLSAKVEQSIKHV